MSEPAYGEPSPPGRPSSPPPYVPQHVYSRDAFLSIRTSTNDTILSLAPALPLASPRAKERWTLRLVHNDWAAAAALASAPTQPERLARTVRAETGGRRNRKSGTGALSNASERTGTANWRSAVPAQLPDLIPVSEDWLKPHPLLDPGQEAPLEEAGKETKDGDEFMDGFLEHARRGEDLLDIEARAGDTASTRQRGQHHILGRDTVATSASAIEPSAELVPSLRDMRLTGADAHVPGRTSEAAGREAAKLSAGPSRATHELWSRTQSTPSSAASLSKNANALASASDMRNSDTRRITAAEAEEVHIPVTNEAGLHASRLSRWANLHTDVAAESSTAARAGSADHVQPTPSMYAGAAAPEHDAHVETLSPSVLAFFNQVRAQAGAPPGAAPGMGTPATQPYPSMALRPPAESIGAQSSYPEPSLYALFGGYPMPPLNRMGPPPGFSFPPPMEPFGNSEIYTPLPPTPQHQQSNASAASAVSMPPRPPSGHALHPASFPGRGGMPPATTFGSMALDMEHRHAHQGQAPPPFLHTGPYPPGPPQNGPPGHNTPFHNGTAPVDTQAAFHHATGSSTGYYRDQRWPPGMPREP